MANEKRTPLEEMYRRRAFDEEYPYQYRGVGFISKNDCLAYYFKLNSYESTTKEGDFVCMSQGDYMHYDMPKWGDKNVKHS